MSVMSKVVTAIATAEAEQDQAVTVAFDAFRAAEQVVTTMHKRVEVQAKALHTLETALGDAALASEMSGDHAAYKKIDVQIATAKSELTRTEAAFVTAQARQVDADHALHIARGAGDVKLIKRLTAAQLRAAREHAEALTLYASTFAKLMQVSDKIVQAWPKGGVAPSGVLIYPNELLDVIGGEIARLAPRDQLSTETALPGSIFSSFHNPFETVPLVTQIEQANAHLVNLAAK